MSHNNSKRQRREEEENDNVSINSSMDNTAVGDGKDAKLAALESKNALLEAKNEILEGKLEIQTLRAKIRERELIEENAALKQTNVEQQKQMESNEKIDELMKQNEKEIAELKAKTEQELMAFGAQLKEAEENAQRQIKEVKEKIDVNELRMESLADGTKEDIKAFGKKLKEAEENAQRQLNEVKETIQVNEVRMESLAEGMLILREEQKQQQQQQNGQHQEEGLEQMKREHLWGHLIKSTQFVKPNPGNSWNGPKTTATISMVGGLQVSDTTKKWSYAVAMEAFGIVAGRNCRKDLFPGYIINYYEMCQMAYASSTASSAAAADSAANWWIGLSAGTIAGAFEFGKHPNSYAIHKGCITCNLSGTDHRFERPNGGMKLELNGQGDVIGCGLVLSPNGKVAIFFTGNGTLLGKPIAITPSGVDRLYPTVFMLNVCLEANFGSDLQAKPFKYDITKCPGMVFE